MTSHRPSIPALHAADADFLQLIPEGASSIGVGTSRLVYPIEGHKDKVLKVCHNSSNAANWAEAVIYWHLTDKSLFGEVLSISVSGKYLVMERLNDVPASRVSSAEVPSWWTDRKTENFGASLTGALKIRDYALVNIREGDLVPMPSDADKAEMKRWLRHFS